MLKSSILSRHKTAKSFGQQEKQVRKCCFIINALWMYFSCKNMVILELSLLVMYKSTYESEIVAGLYCILEPITPQRF